MRSFPKIDTLFDRDKETFKVKEWEYRRPEFEAIDRWYIQEKIDGTNIRLHWNRSTFQPNIITASIHGRTDNADMPTHLGAALQKVVDQIHEGVVETMQDYELDTYTLFGEGYGAKIQKGGGRYRDDQGFILFDVLVNDRTWLDVPTVEATAENLGLQHVPNLGEMSTFEATLLVKHGLKSVAAQDETLVAEGIIARPLTPLYNGRGDRVLWKLKCKDYA